MKPYSTRPKAVAARLRRLTDDAFADREAETSKRTRARKRIAHLLALAGQRGVVHGGTGVSIAKAFLRRVERHLSRGRDVGDIAIRERVTVRRAAEAVEMVRAGALTPPSQSA